jgi:hypothetical protein
MPTSCWPQVLFRHRLLRRDDAAEHVGILLGIELMLNAVNINLVAFARFNADIVGMIFTSFTIPSRWRRWRWVSPSSFSSSG